MENQNSPKKSAFIERLGLFGEISSVPPVLAIAKKSTGGSGILTFCATVPTSANQLIEAIADINRNERVWRLISAGDEDLSEPRSLYLTHPFEETLLVRVLVEIGLLP